MRPAQVLKRERWERRDPLLCFVLACLLRFPGLGAPELTVDETWTWLVVDRVLKTGDFSGSVVMGVDGPLFVALTVLSGEILGLSAFALRLPQAVFGALSVPLAISVFRRRRPGLALPVGLLMAASPFLVFYSKDARPYAQLLFFTLLFVRVFARTPGGRGTFRRLALCLTTILAVTSHYYALVFLAAFYAVVLASHALERRGEALRADFWSGALTFAASVPFLIPLLAGAGSLSAPYWQLASLSIPGIVVEQFFFLGTTLSGTSGFSLLLNVTLASLLALPFFVAASGRRRVENADPWMSLSWAGPAVSVALGVLLFRDLLFYPRGFIPTTPFLFAYWIAFTRVLSSPWRRVYRAVILLPFLFNTLLVSTHHPAHPYFRGRDLLVEIARDAGRDPESYDVVLVHHWWLAQFYYYALPEPEKVRLLGRTAPPLEDLARVPGDARVLLVVNDVAELSDPEDALASALAAERPLLEERRCLYPSLEGAGLICRRILRFGPAEE